MGEKNASNSTGRSLPGPDSPDSDHSDHSESERTLIAEARSGEYRALTELLERYQRRVFGVCYRMTGHADDAADLAQDTLVKVMTNLDRFDGRSAFSTWVIRIAMNVTLSHLRQARKRRESLKSGGASQSSMIIPEAGVDPAKMGELSPGRGVQQSEESSRLTAGLAEIGDEYRALLILRDIQGLEYQQIADVFEIPIGTVKSRLFRARLALRKALARYEERDSESEEATFLDVTATEN